MNKLVIFMFLFCILLIDIVLAATIHGTVYDLSLNPVEKSIVEVDSMPKQRLVAKDGSYSFNLPKGSYSIIAAANGYAAQENITIVDDGEYSLDLFLFPVIDEDLAIDLDIDTGYGKTDYSSYIYAFLVILAAIAAVVLLHRFRRSKTKKSDAGVEKESQTGRIEDFITDEKEIILSIIKKHGNRTTQKDIRKEMPLSEAKVSLIIAELEHEGKIKKIKKGRGNIIILTAENLPTYQSH